MAVVDAAPVASWKAASTEGPPCRRQCGEVRSWVGPSRCSEDRNGLTNTRTTLTSWPVRFLMWNMPYHAEHHLYPAVPLHRLPDLHRLIADRLRHVTPGYPAAQREIVATFAPTA